MGCVGGITSGSVLFGLARASAHNAVPRSPMDELNDFVGLYTMCALLLSSRIQAYSMLYVSSEGLLLHMVMPPLTSSGSMSSPLVVV